MKISVVGRRRRAAVLVVAVALVWACGSLALPGIARADSNCAITQDHSITGDTPSTIEFSNASGATVDIYWLDYVGQRVFYNTLADGQGYQQETWLTHPWVAIDQENGACLGYTLSDVLAQVCEVQPPSRPAISLAPGRHRQPSARLPPVCAAGNLRRRDHVRARISGTGAPPAPGAARRSRARPSSTYRVQVADAGIVATGAGNRDELPRPDDRHALGARGPGRSAPEAGPRCIRPSRAERRQPAVVDLLDGPRRLRAGTRHAAEHLRLLAGALTRRHADRVHALRREPRTTSGSRTRTAPASGSSWVGRSRAARSGLVARRRVGRVRRRRVRHAGDHTAPVDADATTELFQITFDQTNDVDPTWSPDGSTILYTRCPSFEGNCILASINSNGDGGFLNLDRPGRIPRTARTARRSRSSAPTTTSGSCRPTVPAQST